MHVDQTPARRGARGVTTSGKTYRCKAAKEFSPVKRERRIGRLLAAKAISEKLSAA
jgi:hypothetical protein